MIILATACIVTLIGLSRNDALRRLTQMLTLAGLAVAGFAAWTTDANVAEFRYTYFNPNYITGLACVIGFFSALVSWNMPSKADPSVPDSNYRGEFFGMLLFSIAGV